jgi:hypothetical protein
MIASETDGSHVFALWNNHGMADRLTRPKRPRDLKQLAKATVDFAMGEQSGQRLDAGGAGQGPAAVSWGQLAEPLGAIYAKAQDQIITGQSPALQKSVAERPYAPACISGRLVVPINPLLARPVFDSNRTRAMCEAFDGAWAVLWGKGREFADQAKLSATRMILAKRIIYSAQAGEVDVAKLRDDAVAYLHSTEV